MLQVGAFCDPHAHTSRVVCMVCVVRVTHRKGKDAPVSGNKVPDRADQLDPRDRAIVEMWANGARFQPTMLPSGLTVTEEDLARLSGYRRTKY